MPKRKPDATSEAKETSRKRLRTRGQAKQVASAARQPPTTLLTLPRELRNEIYSYLTPTINTVFIESAGKGRSHKYNVKFDHPLSYVCWQTHGEFLQEVALYCHTDAQNVVANVRDFKFHALLGYLKAVRSNGASLEDFDMRAAENDQPGARRLIVRLSASSQWLKEPELRGSIAWAKFMQDLAERSPGSDRTFAMYEFVWAEDAELAQHTLMQTSCGFDMHDNGPWTEVYKSFCEWYRFRGDGKAAERFWERIEKDRRYGLGEMTEEEELEYMDECRKAEAEENENNDRAF
ncbi:hypothetical protein KC363_g4068 [Hortaea werneckii]|nr:hypothetical protein KC325_g1827 [Hortaea werneckii]KAI6998517.1 hypothetical protein KC359_g2309 [Hortaea werneckii]KAI7149246.1 hypothetical protein KC344_g1181 [Hortaea werneckii]KAI7178992.1 hypothetical protein KC360_g1167 [Hortaea werneckii]KAI7191106.1 hypothetical protein KC363_g4068 [Hortaea werneckii]